MNTLRLAVMLSALVFASVSLADYEISWHTIDGGGGVSSGGQYIVTGTIGQAEGGRSSGGGYEVLGGFWPGPQNNPPVADAGNYQAVYKGDTVYLDGSGSYDANFDELTYSWSFVSLPEASAAVLSDPYIVNPSFVADVDGMYIVQLIVNDGFVDSIPDEVQILAMLTPDDEITEALGYAIYAIGEISADDWKKENLADPLGKWIQAAIVMVEDGLYEEALAKLQDHVLLKMDGCAETGYVESNDWITDCEAQEQVYLLIVEAIELLEELVGE